MKNIVKPSVFINYLRSLYLRTKRKFKEKTWD